jgi:hypothetical protein
MRFAPLCLPVLLSLILTVTSVMAETRVASWNIRNLGWDNVLAWEQNGV